MWTQLGRNSFQKRTDSTKFHLCGLVHYPGALYETTTSDKLSESERHEAETTLSLKTSKIIQDKLVRETSKAVNFERSQQYKYQKEVRHYTK